jgi:hypothetical protein
VSRLLDESARALEGDPQYLASALATFAFSEGLTDERLADFLGCEPPTLTGLRWCLRPRSNLDDPGIFRRDVEEIATRFAIWAEPLARVVRRADAIAHLRQATATDGGFLMAARDRPRTSLTRPRRRRDKS